MINPNKYSQKRLLEVISILKASNSPKYRKSISPQESLLTNYNKFIDIIHPLYKNELNKFRISLEHNITNDTRLFRQTTFELMNKDRIEEVHSNILEYLIKNSNYGKLLLVSLIKRIKKGNHKTIIDLVQSARKIEVNREYSIKGNKRIDLYIRTSQFEVIIENKYYAPIHLTTEGELQTDYYYKILSQRHKHKKKLFLIIDKKGMAESKHYYTLDYIDLFKVIEIIVSKHPDDVVLTEYYYLLKREIYKSITNPEAWEIQQNEINELSLSQIYSIIKGINSEII